MLDSGTGVCAVRGDDAEIARKRDKDFAGGEMPGSIELRKKRVLVVGLARTGVATALFCAGHSAIVTATDIRPESELGDAPGKLREAGVKLELGGHQEKTYLAQDLIVPSPVVFASPRVDVTELREGRMLQVVSGRVARERRFRPDRQYREDGYLPPVRAPREAVSCLERLAALTSVSPA